MQSKENGYHLNLLRGSCIYNRDLHKLNRKPIKAEW
jgi:hypothetical protein